jgi:YegS/Rv2252/BmrU family lipid kinase
VVINFIVNPTSGRGRGKKAIRVIKEELTGKKIDFNIQTTTPSRSAITLAKQAVEDGYSKVVAVGGDGTLNEVVNGILQSQGSYPKLGLIPAGTGNNFARGLDMPLNLKESCRHILDPKGLEIDIGRVNDKFFLNSFGVGLNSAVVSEVNQNFKNLRGVIVYILATLKTVPKYQSVDLEITLGTGEKIEGEYLLLVMGNSKIYSSTLNLIPEFEINDGFLDLCLIESMSKAEIMAKFPYFLSDRHHELDEVLIRKVKEARIKVKNTNDFHIDGESMIGDDLQVDILPRVLNLMI